MDPTTLERTRRIAASQRSLGHKIVLTGGFYDILHRGHIFHLEEASSLGHFVIVEMGGDASCRLVKGVGRPVMPAEDRAVIVAAIRYVDHVIVVENDSDKRAVFEAVQPDLYLRGPDYARKEFPEFNLMKPWGDGIVGRSPLVTSTTGILKRLGLMR